MNSVLYIVLSNLAIASCLIPFGMLFSRKMRQVWAYRLIGLYWLLNGLIHFTDVYFFYSFRNSWLDRLTNYYDVVDTPLALLVFASAATGRHRKLLMTTMLLFIAVEIIVVEWKGFDFTSGYLFISSGVLLVIAWCVAGLIMYMRKMEYTPFESSMVVVYVASLFAYGSFLIIALFLHLRGYSEGNSKDGYFLYYISLLLSSVITSVGLWSYGLRRRPQLAL
jgi:hypothetical protein